MIKAVLFDLDGTLTDTIQDISDAMNHALRMHDLPGWTVAEYCYLVGDGAKTLAKRAVRDRQDMKYIIPTYLDNPAFAHAKHGPYLFDLVHDQNESYDVKTKYPKKAEELKQELDRKQQQLTENPRGWK